MWSVSLWVNKLTRNTNFLCAEKCFKKWIKHLKERHRNTRDKCSFKYIVKDIVLERKNCYTNPTFGPFSTASKEEKSHSGLNYLSCHEVNKICRPPLTPPPCSSPAPLQLLLGNKLAPWNNYIASQLLPVSINVFFCKLCFLVHVELMLVGWLVDLQAPWMVSTRLG